MKRSAPHHTKMAALATALKMPLPYAIGTMEMLWQYAAQVSPAGNIGVVSDFMIAGAVAWEKKPALLIDALVACGWLDRDEKHRLIVHDWPDHCEASVKKILERRGHDFIDTYGVSVYEEKKVGRPKLNKNAINGGPTRVAEAMAMAEACISQVTEHTKTRAREESEEPADCTPAEYPEVRRVWEKSMPRLKASERKTLEERVPEVPMPLEEWEERIAAYRASAWGQSNGFPLRGFLKAPQSWELPRSESARESPSLPFSTLAAEIQSKYGQERPEDRRKCIGEWSSEFRGYLDDLGRRIEYVKAEEAWLYYWPHESPEWQVLSREDARELAKERADKPHMIPNPVNHLKSQPWLNIRKTKKTEAEEALEKYYQQYPEERPSV